MRTLAPVQLPVLLLVVYLAGHFTSSTILQNYDRARLLASCLGDDAMTRWRQQLESASKACGLQVASNDQLAPFASYVPYSVPFQVLHPQRQPIQYLAPVPVTPPLQQQYIIKHQQLVPVGISQQQLAASFPFYQQSAQQLYPQQQIYHQQYPQQQQQLYQQQQQLYQPQGSSRNYLSAASQISQVYQPASNQQFSYSVNYLPEQQLLQQQQQHLRQQQLQQLLQQQQQHLLQQEQQQQQQQHLLGQQQTSNNQQEEKRWATQQDTYTNPGLKYEDTEQYQLLQKKLKEAQQQRQALHQTGQTSFHQQMPFFPAVSPTNARQYGPLLPGTVGKDMDKSSQPKKRNAGPEAEGSNNYFQVANFKLPLSNLQQQVLRARTEAMRQQQLGILQERLGDTVDSLTCVMREMKLLTADLQPDYQFLETSLLELPITNPLYEDLLEGQNYCRQTFNCQPQRARLYELPVSSKLSSSLEFFRCFGKEKLRACMKNDLGVLDGLLGGAEGVEPISPGVLRSQNYGTVLREVDLLLNGGSGEIVDLLLL